MNKIYFSNEQTAFEVTQALRGLVRRAVGAALKYEKFPYDCEVSVTFTDNAGIKELNNEYRNIDKETDVLSFPLYEREEIVSMTVGTEDSEDEPVCIGDIVISLEKAEAQAKEYGHSFEREAAFLCVHSVLHLLGYDHEKGKAEESEMFKKQEEILQKMKITRDN